MILCAEYGLRSAKEADHWRCIELPDVVMLRGVERYRVGDRTFGSLDEALRHLPGQRVSVAGNPLQCQLSEN